MLIPARPAPPAPPRPPRLDPNLPWMITDHIWFWRTGINSGPVHPAFDAPRCVPCHFNKSGGRAGRGGAGRWSLSQGEL